MRSILRRRGVVHRWIYLSIECKNILRSPIKRFPVSLNASENPQKNHCRGGSNLSGMSQSEDTYLEGDDRDGHHAKPDHRESIFPSEETRIKETDTGNHDPDQGGGCQHPGDVTSIVNESFGQVGIEINEVTSCGNDKQKKECKGSGEPTFIVSDVDHGGSPVGEKGRFCGNAGLIYIGNFQTGQRNRWAGLCRFGGGRLVTTSNPYRPYLHRISGTQDIDQG